MAVTAGGQTLYILAEKWERAGCFKPVAKPCRVAKASVALCYADGALLRVRTLHLWSASRETDAPECNLEVARILFTSLIS